MEKGYVSIPVKNSEYVFWKKFVLMQSAKYEVSS